MGPLCARRARVPVAWRHCGLLDRCILYTTRLLGREKTVSGIGDSVVRREDYALLRGEAQFMDDVSTPAHKHVWLVRSPLPHARICKLDLDAAKSSDGVVAVLTGAAALDGDLGDPVEIERAVVHEAFERLREKRLESLFQGFGRRFGQAAYSEDLPPAASSALTRRLTASPEDRRPATSARDERT